MRTADEIFAGMESWLPYTESEDRYDLPREEVLTLVEFFQSVPLARAAVPDDTHEAFPGETDYGTLIVTDDRVERYEQALEKARAAAEMAVKYADMAPYVALAEFWRKYARDIRGGS